MEQINTNEGLQTLINEMRPHVLEAADGNLPFSSRRAAARSAAVRAYRAYALAPMQALRGYITEEGDIEREWNANDWSKVNTAQPTTYAALMNEVAAPWTAMAHAMTIVLWFNEVLNGDRECTQNGTGNDSLESAFGRARAALISMHHCFEDNGGAAIFGLPRMDLTVCGQNLPADLNGKLLPTVLANMCLRIFGVDMGDIPRAMKAQFNYKRTETVEKACNNGGYLPSFVFASSVADYPFSGTGTNTHGLEFEDTSEFSEPSTSTPTSTPTSSPSATQGNTDMENDETSIEAQDAAQDAAPKGDTGTDASSSDVLAKLHGMNSNVIPAMDVMLASAGAPNFEKIIQMLEGAADTERALARSSDTEKKLRKLIDEAKAEAEETRRKLSKMATQTQTQPVAVAASGDIPDGKVVMKKVYDVFDIPKESRKPFDFEVPVGEWDAPHPFVPVVNEDYVFDGETLAILLMAVRNNEIPWLKGHTGTGKTTMMEQIFGKLNLPVYRVNLDSDISRGDFVGRETLTTDEDGNTVTKFVEGIIPRSMQQPCLLLLDEIDAARPDMMFTLQRLTERRGFMLMEDGGRTIEPHPFFRMAATANTNGRGDETGLYSGTRALGIALLNRFKPFIDVKYIYQAEEAELLRARVPGLSAADAESIAQYASEHREAFIGGSITLPCSPRDTESLAWAFLNYEGFGSKAAKGMAMRSCILNAADSDDRQVIEGIAKRIWKNIKLS